MVEPLEMCECSFIQPVQRFGKHTIIILRLPKNNEYKTVGLLTQWQHEVMVLATINIITIKNYMYIMHRRLKKNAVAFGIMSNKVPGKQIVKKAYRNNKE